MRKADPLKFCEACGARLARKRFRGRLEDRTRFLSRKHCDTRCMAASMIRADVTLAGLRERAKKHRGAACEACGTTAGLHAHHRDENPANNDPANIATLCGSCHLKWHWREGKRAATRAA